MYYNLGNSYYKAGEIAKAVLNYERALLMKPGNSDIRANLEVARAKTIDKVEPVPEVFFVSWAKALINSMSVDAWATWGIVSFILFTKRSFCSEAKRLEHITTIKKTIPDINPPFFSIICLEKIKK